MFDKAKWIWYKDTVIDSHISFYAERATIANGIFYCVVIEILRKAPCRKTLCAEIYGVRTARDGCAESLRRSRGRQKLRQIICPHLFFP